MRNRLWSVLLALMLLIVGPGQAVWVTASGPDLLSLTVVGYDDWASVQRLGTVGLNIFDLQDRMLAAVTTQAQLDRLQVLGFVVHVADSPAHPDEYYLAGQVGTGNIAPTNAGQTFAYAPGFLLLRANPDQAERWTAAGYYIKKLFGGVVLSTAPPGGEPPRPAALSADPLIKNLVDSVSQNELYFTIQDLQDDPSRSGYDALGSRYSCTPSRIDSKRDYVNNRLAALGLSVRLDPFAISCNSHLYNIEATLPGWGPGADVIYIVGAHYDSISHNTDPSITAPGADDNGSGAASVIEAARVLSAHHFKHTLRFVTFAGEEQGIFGSQFYTYRAANSVPRANIQGMIDLDMVSWDSNHDHDMEIHAGTASNSQLVGAAFRNAIATYGIDLTAAYFTTGSLTFSDHARFWDQGYPAILAMEQYNGNFNTNYHSSYDTLSTLDLSYAQGFVQASVAALAGFAVMIPPGLAVEHFGPSGLVPGSDNGLTIAYSNAASTSASSVQITDTLGAGLTYVSDNSGLPFSQPTPGTLIWQIGNLPAYGARHSFVVTTAVAAGLAVGARPTSTVKIDGVTAIEESADNQATWTGLVPSTTGYLPLILKGAS